MSQDDPQHEDPAMQRRLRRLGSMPVDTAALDAVLRREIAPPPGAAASSEAGPARPRGTWWASARGHRAVAASIGAILVVWGILFVTWGTSASADASAMMLRVHEDLVSGRMQAVQVGSIDEANRALKERWPAGPGVPQVPAEHVMKCCMRDVGNQRLACVLMEVDGVPVSMAVAQGAPMRHPRGRIVEHGGRHFSVEDVSGLTMVMMHRDAQSVCLMGKVSEQRLLAIAAALEF